MKTTRYTYENVADRLPSFEGNNASLDLATQSRLTNELMLYDDQFRDSMRKRSINGKMWCSLQLSWNLGDRVRFHLISVGDEELHSVSLSGHTFSHRGHRSSTVGLMASTMKSVDVSTSYVSGNFVLSSATRDGVDRGMSAMVVVGGTSSSFVDVDDGKEDRTYYIAADEVEWDFLPYVVFVFYCVYSFENDSFQYY